MKGCVGVGEVHSRLDIRTRRRGRTKRQRMSGGPRSRRRKSSGTKRETR